MKIAVLMSTYNGEKYINEQLRSIAMQTAISNITLYIRDDGSSDQTLQIIDKWRDKINIILFTDKNVGPARSFWKLLKNPEIHADYYAFCDQDDVWDKDKIEKQIATLDENIHMSCCNYRLIDAENEIIDARTNVLSPSFTIQDVIVTGASQGCSMVFDDQFREMIISLQISCIPMHDFILELCAIAFECVTWIQDPLFSYRTHSNNVVFRQNRNLTYYFNKYKRMHATRNKDSIELVSRELLNNCGDIIEDQDKSFLMALSGYRNSVSNKFKIIKMLQNRNYSAKSLRSFEAKILLGIL